MYRIIKLRDVMGRIQDTHGGMRNANELFARRPEGKNPHG
jgi:hypothetical protein